MLGASEFGPDFQRVLVRGCVGDPGLRALVGRFVNAGQLGFTDPASVWGWNVVAGAKYPTMLQLQTEMGRIAADNPARAGVSAITTATPDYREDDYTKGQVIEWCRRQVFKAGFEEARQAWNAGDFKAAERVMVGRIEEMQGITPSEADRGWFFEDFHDRQQRRQRVAHGLDYFPSWVAPIDRAMHGGLSYGELEVVVAYSGIGKTFWCVSRGVYATRMRRRVLHFVLEGGRAKTEDRYEAAFADALYTSIRRGDIGAALEHEMAREYAILKELLVVRGFNDPGNSAWRISYDHILEELATLRRTYGWRPDLIIVDYGDLMDAPGDTPYAKQKMSFRQLKALSERDGGYAVSSPSQARRPSPGADAKEHVVKPQDIADCYEKVRVADAILSLNRTTLEKENEQARVFLGKYRDNEDGALVRVQTNYTRGMFNVPGIEPDPLDYAA